MNSHKVKDHLGVEYESIAEMCRAWGLPKNIYYHRIERGYSLSDTLTGNGIRSVGESCVDHLGIEYESISEMCRAWGVELNTYIARIKKGYSVEKALNTNRVVAHVSGYAVECEDHTGRKFTSLREMCDYWGVTYNCYYARRLNGCSIEQALTGIGLKTVRPKKCEDHTGKEFNSEKEMCKHWKVNYTTFIDRKSKGYSLESSLTGKGVGARKKSCVDHLGNKFSSESEMCRYWNIPLERYITYRNRGYSIENVLTGKGIEARKKSCVDHLGNTFESISAMCRAYGIERKTYMKRIERGMSIKEALTKRTNTKGE